MSDAKHALTVLTRLANRRPQETPKLERALAGRLKALGTAAIEVALETGDPIGWVLSRLISQAPDESLAAQLLPMIPQDTIALRELAVTATELSIARLPLVPPDSEARISLELDLAVRLSAVGRRAEALGVATKAVEQIERSNGAHSALLARALSLLSSCFTDVGRHQESLLAIERCVALRRAAGSDTQEKVRDFARGLHLLAASLHALGRRADAVKTAEEGVALLRGNGEPGPADLPDYAGQLQALAALRIDNGEFDTGIEDAAKALEYYRTLADRAPDRYLFFVAVGAHNLANNLSLRRRFSEALPLAEEATEAFSALAQTRPDAFAEYHALSLNTLSNRLNDLGRTQDAIEASRRSVATYRDLCASEAVAFEAKLGQALHTLAYRLYEAGETGGSLAVIDEALALWRRLEKANAKAHRVSIAMSLAVRGASLRKEGRLEEACSVISAAVVQLVRYAPDLGPAIAREAREIGGRAIAWHKELGRPPDCASLETLRQATSIEGYGEIS